MYTQSSLYKQSSTAAEIVSISQFLVATRQTNHTMTPTMGCP